ncbi:hypothetical protein JW711_02660 [Candidatus Woesearchaeota archaeon]|nr:hypothetical protein [Candidatus Woesearchaeota archaeon]
MAVIGFSFTKMIVERFSPVKGKISINNNVGVTSLEETKLDINTDKKSLKLSFEFTSAYEPKIAKILLQGEVIYLIDKDKAADVIANWKKNKKLDNSILEQVLNNVLAKCNVEALILSKDMNLPPPMALPKVGIKQ